MSNKFTEKELNTEISVCDKCLMSCCLQGLFMCYESRDAGIVLKPIKELLKLKKEHPSYLRKALKNMGEDI